MEKDLMVVKIEMGSLEMLTSSSIRYRTPILHSHLLPSRTPAFSSFRLQCNSLSHFRSSPFFLKSHPLLETKPLVSFLVQAKSPPANRPDDSKFVHEGMVTESLPNGMFWVRLDNQHMILGYVCGKIRKFSIGIFPGNRVRVEVSRYDSSKGRIVFRLSRCSS